MDSSKKWLPAATRTAFPKQGETTVTTETVTAFEWSAAGVVLVGVVMLLFKPATR